MKFNRTFCFSMESAHIIIDRLILSNTFMLIYSFTNMCIHTVCQKTCERFLSFSICVYSSFPPLYTWAVWKKLSNCQYNENSYTCMYIYILIFAWVTVIWNGDIKEQHSFLSSLCWIWYLSLLVCPHIGGIQWTWLSSKSVWFEAEETWRRDSGV